MPFQQAANFFEGTEDALDWLVSDDNPLRGLGQNAEHFFNAGPPPSDPDVDTATFEQFRTAGVDGYQVALRSSTHLERTYIPYILPASSEGERVAMHYTLAWFDRWLKGGDATLPAGEPVADHLSRYLRSAYAFDDRDCADMLSGC